MHGVNLARIARIFITHLHGDHFLGLMGVVSSMHLLGRLNSLDVHGPPGLKEVIDVHLRVSETHLRFPLHFHPLQHRTGALVYRDDRVEVTELALRHRVTSTGFLFKEAPRPRKLLKEKVGLIPHYSRSAVKLGADLELPDGTVVPNAELTLSAPPQRSYAYCSDTAYAPALVPHLQGVDLLYHEATFAEALAARAKETMHSTAKQAATIARDAGVKQLLLGHFSSRYKDPGLLLDEARTVFPHSLLAEEGMTYKVGEQA